MLNKNIKYVILGVLLVGLSIFSFNLSETIIPNENDHDNNITNHLTSAGFWNLTGSPISIDDNDPSKNWSYTASHYDWCSGSGNWTDPYVIENVSINGQGLGSCIEIINSIAYFIIKNCTTYNSGTGTYDAGIYLEKTDNGIIMDNNCSYYNRYGFLLLDTSNNTLSGNIANNNSRSGFMLSGGGNNKIINNTLFNNNIILSGMNNNLSENKLYEAGISLNGNITECASHLIDTSNRVNGMPIYYYANEIGLEPINFTGAGQIILVNTSKSLISDLEIFNSSAGISLYYSHDNDIQKNNFSFNRYGIYLYNSCNNIITENNLNNNHEGLLVYLNSDNNTIVMNDLTKNYIGIYFQDCHNNSILHNNISSSDYHGIICYSNTYNNFSYNIINFNGDMGIYYTNSHNGTFMNNTLKSNENYGIYFKQSDSNLILHNNINKCGFSGIYFYGGVNNNLSGNLLFNCGYSIYSENQLIDTNNKVNDKLLYYYVNKNGLTPSNFSNAGQVILINCNYSLISDIDVSYGTCGILLSKSNNNTIKNSISSFNKHYGIYFIGECSKNTVIANNINNNSQGGIILSYYSKNNKIQNNNVSHNGYIFLGSGIGLGQSCDNNSIIGNNLNYNYFYGIKLSYNEKNNLSNNHMMGCGLGIIGHTLDEMSSHYIDITNKVNQKSLYYYKNKQNLRSNNFTNAGQVLLFNCTDSFISNIDVSYSSQGISLYSCINITILNINSSFNSESGVYLSSCYNCSILKSVITNNWYQGIRFSRGDYNIIEENDINLNKIGIEFYFNDFCIISGNSLINNSIYGIRISGGTNNCTFYSNKFIENGKHVFSSGYYNKWDNGYIGNYWDNYTGLDLNDDGIGDSPHFVLKDNLLIDNYDNFPILDITIPNLTIYEPINEEIYGVHAPEFNIEIKDSHLDKMWYKINNGATNIFFISNGTINQTLWNTIYEGNVIIRFYANDSVGNINFEEVTVKKDVTGPIITIQSPLSDEVFGINAPDFIVEISEVYLDTMWYTLDGGITNYTIISFTGTINQIAWDNSPEGIVIIKFYANDTLGRKGFREVSVIKEISQPNPPGIPGYNLLFIVGIISVMVVIIIKRRVNHLN